MEHCNILLMSSGETAPDFGFCQITVLIYLIFGIIGITLSSNKTVYLFYNIIDAVITSLSSLFLLGVFLVLLNNDGTGNFEVLGGMIGFLLFIPAIFTFFTNPENRWSCIFVIPAKTLIGALGIVAVLGTISKFLDAFKHKNERGINVFTGALFGALSYGVYKIIMNTTKKMNNQGE